MGIPLDGFPSRFSSRQVIDLPSGWTIARVRGFIFSLLSSGEFRSEQYKLRYDRERRYIWYPLAESLEFGYLSPEELYDRLYSFLLGQLELIFTKITITKDKLTPDDAMILAWGLQYHLFSPWKMRKMGFSDDSMDDGYQKKIEHIEKYATENIILTLVSRILDPITFEKWRSSPVFLQKPQAKNQY